MIKIPFDFEADGFDSPAAAVRYYTAKHEAQVARARADRRRLARAKKRALDSRRDVLDFATLEFVGSKQH
jgi:hypothetical protein